MALTDRYVSSAAGGGGDGSSGTPWTLAEAIANEAAGDIINIKADGTYTVSANQTLGNGSSGSPIMWRGYTTTIGDGGRATIEWNHTSTGAGVFTVGTNRYFQDLIIQPAASEACSRVMYISTGPAHLFRCSLIASDLANDESIQCGGTVLTNCVLHGQVNMINYGNAYYSYILSGQTGILTTGNGKNVVGCIIKRNGSTGGAGINCDWSSARTQIIANNVIYGFQDGILSSDASNTCSFIIVNNIFYSLSRYGINYANTAQDQHPLCINNAFGSITSGNFNGINSDYQFGSISLSGDPFTNAASDDFTLNNTAGAGASCRSAGLSTDVGITGSQNNWFDVGALQVEPSAGSSGGGGPLIGGRLIV